MLSLIRHAGKQVRLTDHHPEVRLALEGGGSPERRPVGGLFLRIR